jgi:hypothetical protein
VGCRAHMTLAARVAVAALAAASLLLGPAGARADDWPGPQPRMVVSSDLQWSVRIIPGSSHGDQVGFAGAPTGPYARALFHARQPDGSLRQLADVPLANPVAPVDALVTRRGELITFDNWHNAGFGAAVAIYDAAGRRLATFTLEQLYGATKAAQIPRSVSSRWWRCAAKGFVDPARETAVYVREHFGGRFSFRFTPPFFSYHAPAPGAPATGCPRPAGPLSTTSHSGR